MIAVGLVDEFGGVEDAEVGEEGVDEGKRGGGGKGGLRVGE